MNQRSDSAVAVRITSVQPLDGIRAGSGLLTLGDRLLVVGDDAEAVAWVDLSSSDIELRVLRGSGEALPKLNKPDYEAAARAADGSVWIFGSGSLANRRGLVRLSGEDHTTVEHHDGSPLYLGLDEHLGSAANIEGALFVDDGLLLCHRGAAAEPDVVLKVDHPAALPAPVRVRSSRAVTAPQVGGVQAHITDVAAIAGGLAFLAAAEETPDAIADGPVAGALLGIGTTDGTRWLPLLEPDGTPTTRKAEGLVIAEDASGGWLVTDRDDPALPAELCRFELS